MSTTTSPKTTSPKSPATLSPAGSNLSWLECSPKKRRQLQAAVAESGWLDALRDSWGRSSRPALLWGMADESVSPEIRNLVKGLFAAAEVPPAGQWLTVCREVLATGTITEGAIVNLAAAYALPDLARSTDDDVWWEMVEHLASIESPSVEAIEHAPLPAVWLGGELPFVLGTVLAEFRRAGKRLRKSGAGRLARIAEIYLDGTGLPYCAHWSSIRPWLAAWTRVRDVACEASIDWPGADPGVDYEWLLRRSLQLTRGDGSSMFSCGPPWEEAFLESALACCEDATEQLLAHSLRLPVCRSSVDPENRIEKPDPSEFSEWAQGAVMRSGWKSKSGYLAVAFDRTECHAELGIRRKVLAGGIVTDAIQVNGRPLEAAGEWVETCAFSEDGVDYLELEQRLESGWRLQRQWMFVRRQRLVLLADALLGTQDARLEMKLTLPLASGVDWLPEEETQDGWLVAEGKRQGWVVPLAAPEWKVGDEGPVVEQVGSALTVRATGKGRALYLPVLIDLHGLRRDERLRTWRALTVAERLRIVKPDEAVGYRVQVGTKQWLFYRSLAAPSSRTLLGQNLVTEFFAGRFHRTGEAVPYVEVESDDVS